MSEAPFKKTAGGWTVLADDSHLSRWVEETGDIEHGQQHFKEWRPYVKEGDTVLDVGAAIGDTTVPLARLVGPKGHVYAFEPNPLEFECLTQNLCNAGVDEWVTPIMAALGERPGTLRLALQTNVGASFLTNVFPAKSVGYINVDVITLDSIGIEKCSFIKVDVEGFEPYVIRGGEQMIARFRPIIQLELAVHSSRYGIPKDAVVEEMTRRGYRCTLDPEKISSSFQIDAVFVPAAIDFSV